MRKELNLQDALHGSQTQRRRPFRPLRHPPVRSSLPPPHLFSSDPTSPRPLRRHEWQKLHNPNFGDRKVVTPRVGPGIPAGGTKKKKSGGGTGGTGGLSSTEARLAAGGSLGGDEEGGQPGVGPNGLTAWDEAVLGEVDADFVPSGSATNASAAMALAASLGRGGTGSSSTKKAARMAAATEEAMALEEAEDSDDEADLVMRAVAASAGGRPLVEGPSHAMGSWWMSRWNRFGRWGTREAYREAFRLGAGGTGQTAVGVYGR